MPPIKLSDRERNLAFITLGALLFYIFFQFLYTPKWVEIGQLKEKARGLRLDLRIAEGKMKIMEGLERSTGMLPPSASMTQGEKILEVLKDLSSTTARSGLNLLLIKPEPSDKDQLVFSLTCNGSYKDLYSFFVLLRAVNKLILFDNLTVSGGGKAAPVLAIQMKLRAYY